MANLGFFDAETVLATSALDLGTVAPRSSDDSGLWLTNGSDFLAEDVTVTVSGGDSGQLWLSLDGEAFYASINVGDIAPGGSSIPFWLRRVTSSASSTGGRNGSVTATPSAWSNPVDTSTSDNIPLT